jgi:host cell surface-exposed lipoprotein
MIETPSNPLAPQRSADGLWEWNGTQWMPTQPAPGGQQVAQSTPVVEAAPPAQTARPAQTTPISPDGKHQWDGTAWIPVKKKGHLVRNVGIVVGALLLVSIGGAIASSGNSNKNSTAGTTIPSSPAVTAAATAEATAAATAKAAPAAPAGPTLTNQQQNAAGSAQDYLDFMAFSRQGLIDQLSSAYGDGYSVKDATIAVDSLKADWNAEAVESAKDYLKTMHFSCKGLIQQLDSAYGEKFTVAQATYGAKQAGAC